MSSQSFIRNGLSYFRFSNGVEIKVRPVSPAIFLELQKKYPEPQVPIVESEVGDGSKIREENPADPDYKRAYAEWDDKQKEMMSRILLLRAAECEVDVAQVEETREFYRSEFEIELDKNDKFVYLNYCFAQRPRRIYRFCRSPGRAVETRGGCYSASYRRLFG
jgi:hypothetical protein